MNIRDFVFETFLRLTSKTCPYGDEDYLVKENIKLFPEGIETDAHGNYFYKIGESRTIFSSHLDTVSKDVVKVTHVFTGNFIKTDGRTILGADDKAGVTIMLWMIKNKVPGLYYFFAGEEVGCIGSGLAAKYLDFGGKYDRMVSFDRRGTGSVITHQSCGRSCSDDFADNLCDELNDKGLGLRYSKDSGGIYTDSAEFVDIIPECTNISVGYYREHTMNESQDIEHLALLSDACTKIDWEKLVTKRDPSVVESRSRYRSWGVFDDNDYAISNNSYPSDTYDDWRTDDYDDYDPNTGKWVNSKKTRRGRKGKKYYDNGNGLSLLDPNRYDYSKDDRYTWVLDKFLDGELTLEELEIIKDQYLDMQVSYDVFFYNYLLEQFI